VRVIVGCESSGTVRDAFIAAGHDAISCDLLPTETPGPHIVGDVLHVLHTSSFDLAILHPPCTYLCSSGLHWNTRRPERRAKTEDALAFVSALMASPVPRWLIENPIGCISDRIRPPDQIVHPWQFGDDASKSTCFWLKNVNPLEPTRYAPPEWSTRNHVGETKPTADKTSSHRAPPAGRNAAGPIRASPRQWQRNYLNPIVNFNSLRRPRNGQRHRHCLGDQHV